MLQPYYDKDDNFIGNTLPNQFETASQIIKIQVENNTDQSVMMKQHLNLL